MCLCLSFHQASVPVPSGNGLIKIVVQWPSLTCLLTLLALLLLVYYHGTVAPVDDIAVDIWVEVLLLSSSVSFTLVTV